MAVPILNFAQMPLVQPRSEMAGFSNSLLEAGKMRQERLAANQIRADQQAQLALENQRAQAQLGFQERAADLNDKQFGLAQNADVRAGKLAEQTGEMNTLTIDKEKKAAEAKQKEAAVSEYLSTPEAQQRLAAYTATGDEIGKLNFIEQTGARFGISDSESMLQMSEARQKAAQAKLSLKMGEESILTSQSSRRANEAQIATEGIKQAGLKLEMERAKLGPQVDPKFALQQTNAMSGSLDKIGALVKDEQDHQKKLGIFQQAAATETPSQVEAMIATEENPENKADLNNLLSALKGNDAKKVVEARAKLSTRINGLIDVSRAAEKKIRFNYNDAYNNTNKVFSQTLSPVPLPNSYPLPKEEQAEFDAMYAPPKPPAPPMTPIEAMQDTFSQVGGSIAAGIADLSAQGVGMVKRAERATRLTGPATILNAAKNSMNLPVSPVGRPSAATQANYPYTSTGMKGPSPFSGYPATSNPQK